MVKKLKKILIIITFLFLKNSTLISKLVTGNITDGSATFNFNITNAIYSQTQNRLWTAAKSDLSTSESTTQQYSLSVIPSVISDASLINQITAIPMTTQNITTYSYDSTTDLISSSTIPNIFLNGQISIAGLSGNLPIIFSGNNLNTIYLAKDTEFYSSTGIKNTSEFYTATCSTSGNIFYSIFPAYNGFFTLSAPSNEAFGENLANLSLSFYSLQTSSNPQNKTQPNYLAKITSTAFDNSEFTDLISNNTANTPTINNIAPSFIQTNFGNYFGLSITPTNNTDPFLSRGALALLLLKLTQNNSSINLEFASPVSSAIDLTTKNTVISNYNSDATIEITNLSTLKTSTGLTYLVLAQDSGTGTQQKIYILPIVTYNSNSSNIGLIADQNSIKTSFLTQYPYTFLSRDFDTPLSDINQLVSPISVGGTLPINLDKISLLYTLGDSIYIVINSNYSNNTTPGTFRSQVLFDATGKVISSTAWAPVLGTIGQLNSYSYISATNTFGGYILNNSNNTASVYQTLWLNNSNLSNFSNSILQNLPQKIGGIQGLFNFSGESLGLQNSALLIATGFENAIVCETALADPNDYNILKPIQILNPAQDTPAINLNFNSSGALTCAAIVSDILLNASPNNNQWLFFSGVNGLYVLLNQQNISWQNQLDNLSTGSLQTNLSIKQISNLKYIKKIASDFSYKYNLNYLYCMTPKQLVRFNVTAINLSNNNIDGILEILYDCTNTEYYCKDFIVDNDFILLGTTNGLFSINSTNINNLNIKQIQIPGGYSSVNKIFAITDDQNPYYMYKNFSTLSNIYVTTIDFSTHQAAVNRFLCSNSIISNLPDTPIQSQINQSGINSFYLRFPTFTNSFFTDGSWNLTSSFKTLNNIPMLNLIYSGFVGGMSNSQNINVNIGIKNENLSFLNSAITCETPLFDPITGTLNCYGDFGLLTNF